MPYSIQATALRLEARMKAAGYVASIDPEQVYPPGVWIQPRTVTDRDLHGGGELVVWLYLLAPNVETHDALRVLDDLLSGLDELDVAVDPDDPDVDLTAAVALPSSPSTPLPAYRLAVRTDLVETP